jgi:hypothetical protein
MELKMADKAPHRTGVCADFLKENVTAVTQAAGES